MENNTLILTDITPECKHVGCIWIFKKKLRLDDTIDKFKARLVAKSFIQQKDIDFFDTYSHVASISSIKIFLALASIHNMFIHQMNVKSDFLNGDSEEEIYMDQPEWFITKEQENKVCKLVKSLYELKQAPWHQKFKRSYAQFEFTAHKHDKWIYSKNFDNNYIILVGPKAHHSSFDDDQLM